MTARRIGVLIDSPPSAPYHRATVDALRHAADDDDVDIRIITTDDPTLDEVVRGCAGVVIGPGSPYRDEQAVWSTIAGARERGVPLVGT